ncbi:hypothetical protein PCANC_15457 [Puccinia coronata f. sp. avenae]|uniref:K Homology domain-containing protein n=1 Tax=Puccinia coronata f. sp. avenae TaxID=200324 RepID=A0A2N5UHS9_9BASI|nr:hypothetical protein PCANC_15457 [Puccinia coronata f. sp. avenae]
MDFYSTFLCLPSLSQPQAQGHTHKHAHSLPASTTAHTHLAPSPPCSSASSSPHHSTSEHSFVIAHSPPATAAPVSLPLISRIPSRITTSTTTSNNVTQAAALPPTTSSTPGSTTSTANITSNTSTTNSNSTTTITTPTPATGAHQHLSTVSSAVSPPRSATTHSTTSSSASSCSSFIPQQTLSSLDVSRPIPQNAPLPAPEIVQAACAELMSDYHCLVNSTQITHPPTYAFHLSGSFPQVMAARGRLLREQPFQVESLVAVDRNDVLENGPNVRPVMKIRLDEIASASRAHLSIVGNPRDGGGIDVVVRGDAEAVEEARVRLLVLLDQLNGLHSEVCEIDYKLHHIIAGRKRSVIQSIQEETATNIYFPSVLSGGGILGARSASLVEKQNIIFITGEFFGVQRAREMLFQVSMHKSKCIISRDTAMLPRKLDWLLMQKLPQLQEIMYDNGTFINFPPIGSQISVLSVYGDHRVHIERTIRSLMQLACEFYIANVWLLPKSIQDVYPNGSQPSTLNQAAIQSDGNRISTESGAEVVFKSTNSFEVYGTEKVTKRAVEKILELDMVKNSQVEIRFQVELACEHRDFISGKKNGKLNKIMKTSNVKIKFESFNDYNFMLNLSGNPATAMMGLTLLEEELPAEISFHIPEGYHKRIIGVGGKNIQRIMKKYGVYVKFSNAKEFAKLGGYHNNHDNVVARTPAKNAENLENLKQSVMELVHPKDKDFVIEHLNIDRTQHRTILGEKSIFIHDIESKTNTCFYFPSTESGSSTIEIFGPRSQIAIAKQMIMSHIGLEADFRLVATSDLMKVVASDEFDEKVIQTCKNHWNVTVLVINGGAEGEGLTIKFGLTRANTENLQHARETLEAFLIEKKINFHRERSATGSYPRRNTVTSIGSLDRSTNGFNTWSPPTPTDTASFSTINRHGSEKDLQGLVDRTNNPYHYPSLSSSTNSSSSYAYHPAMSMSRLYNQFVGLEGPIVGVPNGPTPIGAPGNTDWNSLPRQMIKSKYNSANPLAGVVNMPNSPIGKPIHGSSVLSTLDGNSYPSFVNRKNAISPRAQSLDLGRPTFGSGSQLSKDYDTQGLFNGISPIGGEPSSRAPGSSPVGLGHRHRFSQGGLNNYSSGLMNGFAGLNLGL